MTEGPSSADLARQHDAAHPAADHSGHNTTPTAWIAVTIIIAGFIVGGIALIEWNWLMFWIGVGVAVIGCIIGGFAGIMEQVTEYGGGGRGGDPETSGIRSAR